MARRERLHRRGRVRVGLAVGRGQGGHRLRGRSARGGGEGGNGGHLRYFDTPDLFIRINCVNVYSICISFFHSDLDGIVSVYCSVWYQTSS